MEMIPVESSNVVAIGYDEESQTLQIEFSSGAIYQYFDVPQNAHDELMQAESIGRHLAKHIKGHFRYSRV